jgi:hypothetical protein
LGCPCNNQAANFISATSDSTRLCKTRSDGCWAVHSTSECSPRLSDAATPMIHRLLLRPVRQEHNIGDPRLGYFAEIGCVGLMFRFLRRKLACIVAPACIPSTGTSFHTTFICFTELIKPYKDVLTSLTFSLSVPVEFDSHQYEAETWRISAWYTIASRWPLAQQKYGLYLRRLPLFQRTNRFWISVSARSRKYLSRRNRAFIDIGDGSESNSASTPTTRPPYS